MRMQDLSNVNQPAGGFRTCFFSMQAFIIPPSNSFLHHHVNENEVAVSSFGRLKVNACRIHLRYSQAFALTWCQPHRASRLFSGVLLEFVYEQCVNFDTSAKVTSCSLIMKMPRDQDHISVANCASGIDILPPLSHMNGCKARQSGRHQDLPLHNTELPWNWQPSTTHFEVYTSPMLTRYRCYHLWLLDQRTDNDCQETIHAKPAP